MNQPIYKIQGKERRKLKHRFNFLKSFLKSFWKDHQLEKDMISFYGGDMMSDEKAKEVYQEREKEMLALEKKLSETLK